MLKCVEFQVFYVCVLDVVEGCCVVFCILDIGLDKVLFYMKLQDEFNLVLGWCVICVGLDKFGVLWMQLQVLICVVNGGLLIVMFLFVVQLEEFCVVKVEIDKVMDCECIFGYVLLLLMEIGVMLEIFSFVFVLDVFF